MPSMLHMRQINQAANAPATTIGIMRGLWWTDKLRMASFFLFFFQAEDGIRDDLVTGVQTCALPISLVGHMRGLHARAVAPGRIGQVGDVAGAGRAVAELVGMALGEGDHVLGRADLEIGRASCRERV